jgi:hypothetical protein
MIFPESVPFAEAVVETKRQHTEKYISTANKRLTLRIPSIKRFITVVMGTIVERAAINFVTRKTLMVTYPILSTREH